MKGFLIRLSTIAEVAKELGCSVATVRRHINTWPNEYRSKHIQVLGGRKTNSLSQEACSRLAHELSCKGNREQQANQQGSISSQWNQEVIEALQAHIGSLKSQIDMLEREIESKNKQIETLTQSLVLRNTPWYKRLLGKGSQV